MLLLGTNTEWVSSKFFFLNSEQKFQFVLKRHTPPPRQKQVFYHAQRKQLKELDHLWWNLTKATITSTIFSHFILYACLYFMGSIYLQHLTSQFTLNITFHFPVSKLQSDGKEAHCGAGIPKVLNWCKARESAVEEPDAVCGWKDSGCTPARKNSKKEMFIRDRQLAFPQACCTAALYVGNSNVMSSVSGNKQLLWLSCITIWKIALTLKSFQSSAKQERNVAKDYLPWKPEAPVTYHLEHPSMSFLWLQDLLESKGSTNLPSYLD